MMKTVSKKRDLQKDWELCQRATPGKWGVVAANSEGPYMIRMPYREGGMWYGIRMVFWKEDAEFIAEAREGWPEAIQRALIAEAQVKELKAMIEFAKRKIRTVLIALAPGDDKENKDRWINIAINDLKQMLKTLTEGDERNE